MDPKAIFTCPQCGEVGRIYQVRTEVVADPVYFTKKEDSIFVWRDVAYESLTQEDVPVLVMPQVFCFFCDNCKTVFEDENEVHKYLSVEKPKPKVSLDRTLTPQTLNKYQRILRENKRVVNYDDNEEVWVWHERDDPFICHGQFSSYWDALLDAVGPFFE